MLFKESIQKFFAEFSHWVTMNVHNNTKTNIRNLKRELRACEDEDENMN